MPPLDQPLSPSRFILEAARLMALYPPTFVSGLLHRRQLEDLRTFALFVGCSRSGHSLVGSQLDAHPNIVISHETGVLKYVRAGYRRSQICELLRQNSSRFAAAGARSKRYDYLVPNQWQGRSSRVIVLGDNMAEGATRRLRQKPGLLHKLEAVMAVPVKLIQVVRNPFDNISTIALRTRKRQLASDLAKSAKFYFSLCETVQKLRNEMDPDNLIELRHEALIDSPKESLSNLCSRLGVETTSQYLDDCSGIFYSTPHRSRHDVQWSEELIDEVQERMRGIDFLEGYTFADPDLSDRGDRLSNTRDGSQQLL